METSKANVDNFKKVFDEAVKAEVEKKIPSHVPPAQGGGSDKVFQMKTYKHSFNKFK